jgi:hypothetical protein
MSEYKSVQVNGATGMYMDRINGFFDFNGDSMNGSPVYRHRQHKDVFFIFDRDRRKWKIRCSDLDGKTIAKFFWDESQPSVQNTLHGIVEAGLVPINWVVKAGIRVQKYTPAEITMVVAE